jgi:thiol-disulfide isomerase/thioredoxin
MAHTATSARSRTRGSPQKRRGAAKNARRTPWAVIASCALVVVALVAVIVLVTAQHGTSATTASTTLPRAASPTAGTSAPAFTVKAQDGTTLTAQNLLGKPSLVVFFASWCPHCQAEAPRIAQLAAAHPELQIVMIGVGDRETIADIYGFQSRVGMATYADTSASTLGTTAAAWGIQSYPSLFAVDAQGIVRASNVGEVSQQGLDTLVAAAES